MARQNRSSQRFSLDAFRTVAPEDRAGFEQLCRYTSLPIALSELVTENEFHSNLAHAIRQKRPSTCPPTVRFNTTLVYNAYITISDIPLAAYDYVVNGKSALDWVVERQCVKTDKDSGIVNDANAWALETMHNPRYPLDLFLRVITVSLETMKLVNALPGLDI